ncbi:hypothetical protein [Actinomadura opuntiae]|uniref:hypothetical protein n=1 Tax=Actinomadura sp. OS1-43 TaxID=604315 RepID=UPI00255B08AE|nr:hypothetical protein [Actinomadura sp. OS1-43]MDL4814960.1 hypothetical protein [Actinomadura sp. OS1-43]MDL4815462.1 hypothetical protein [Actinomadura sp. OS1-43]
MGDETSNAEGQTYITRFRIPRPMWDAFGRVSTRLGSNRTARLLEHVRADIEAHGDDQDRADLARADEELAERRSRKGGRPPKS